MYDAQDAAALMREHARFVSVLPIQGPRLTFREATPDDAEYILSLRLDPAKNAHLSPVADDVEAQREWLRQERDELYFIIETDRPVGTVRLYDQRGTSFCWGSWILKDAPQGSARESMGVVYELAIDLGFKSAHFDVRKANEKVWRFHEKVGAERVGETEDSYLYEMHMPAMLKLARM